jgi:hypothetical protein
MMLIASRVGMAHLSELGVALVESMSPALEAWIFAFPDIDDEATFDVRCMQSGGGHQAYMICTCAGVSSCSPPLTRVLSLCMCAALPPLRPQRHLVLSLPSMSDPVMCLAMLLLTAMSPSFYFLKLGPECCCLTMFLLCMRGGLHPSAGYVFGLFAVCAVGKITQHQQYALVSIHEGGRV